MNHKKNALVLGGGGFIGGHLSSRLKKEGYWVRIVDIKTAPDFWLQKEICDEYISGDLRNIKVVDKVFKADDGKCICFDEVYQLAADMGGAGYIFTGENDADVMHNSSLINLNILNIAAKSEIGKIFYSSSACVYPKENQIDPSNPNCEESTAYPANPDSEYGWEKLFSERLFLAFEKNHTIKVRIARFHNVYGPKGTWYGGKEKAPAALCRKVIESDNSVEIWGDGKQTRSFLYIDDCVEAMIAFMHQDKFSGPVNIGSEEMVTIDELAKMIIQISAKQLQINTLYGEDFVKNYGFECPIGVNGRNSDNTLIFKKTKWQPKTTLVEGLQKTFKWIKSQIKLKNNKLSS